MAYNQSKQSLIQQMSHRQSIPPYGRGRNSTIKEQDQANNNNNLQNDSSISLREGTDVHYYDLNYSDEHEDNDIVSSSDDDGREITHEEFMYMISTNMDRKEKSEEGSCQQKKYQEDDEEESEQSREGLPRYERRKSHTSKHPQSNDFKQAYYHPNQKKYTPSTRDKSHNFYQHAQKRKNLQRNDPEKSKQVSKHTKKSKEASFNAQNSVNSVKQFRIDSFLNAHAAQQKQKSKAWKQYREMKPKSPQDSEFSLITLPQYDESSSSITSQNRQSESDKQIQRYDSAKRLSKYRNVAQLQTQEDLAYDRLNWRYQEAKLKFMDSFLPDSMKIGSSGYNMLKYMERKNDLTFNILKVL